MNKPIRTISIFCLLLFVALMINATYLQYWKAADYYDDPRNRRVMEAAYSRERGAILVGREPVARERGVRRRVQVPAHATRSRSSTPTSPASSPSTARPASSSSQNDVLSGDDSRLFVTRLVDLLSNNVAKGGNVAAHDRPARPRTRRSTGSRALGTERQRGLGRGDRARAPARSWRWSRCRPSTPTSWPPTTSRPPAQTTSGSTTTRASRWSTGRSRPRCRRGRRSSWSPRPPRSRAASTTPTRRCPAARPTSSRRRPADPASSTTRAAAAATARDPVRARRWRSRATPPSPSSAVEVGAEAMQDQAEAFGFNEHYLDDLGPQVESRSSRPTSTSRRPVSPAIGQFDVRATPLQMAMVAAGIANERHRDEALPRRRGAVARPRRARQDRARGALPGDLGRRRPTR